MTFSRPARLAAAAARPLPAIASTRLAAVAASLTAAEAVRSAGDMPAQHAARALIGAEQALAEAESRFVEAKADCATQSRLRQLGMNTDRDVAIAQHNMAVAEESRVRAGERVDQLRRQLQQRRRDEKLAADASSQVPSVGERRSSGRALFGRLLGR